MSNVENPRYQRHSEFVTPLEQEKLSNARVLIAGCGIGSQLATRLVRMGIATNGALILADPGSVELSNLSRQDFYEEDIGKNKAEALRKNLLRINSQAHISAVTEGVTLENTRELVIEADVIADMIDISAPHLSLALHDEAKRQQKPVTTGLDVGEGTIIYAFNYRDPSAMTLRDFLGLSQMVRPENMVTFPSLAVTAQFLIGPVGTIFSTKEAAKQYYDGLIENRLEEIFIHLPPEMRSIVEKLRAGELDYIPQIDSAVGLQAVQQSVVIRRLILGQLVTIAPDSIRENIVQQITF